MQYIHYIYYFYTNHISTFIEYIEHLYFQFLFNKEKIDIIIKYNLVNFNISLLYLYYNYIYETY